MPDFDDIIDPPAEWADIQQISVTALVLAGPGGPANAQAVAVAKRFNFLKSTAGGTVIGWLRAGAGAVATTLAKWMGWQTPSVFEYMTDAQIADCASNTAATDVYAALQAAIDGTSGLLRLPNGKYRLSQKLIVRNNCTGIIGDGAYTAVFDKRFNGDAISSLTTGAVLSGFGINGNGGTYTGAGIRPEGYNTKLTKLRIVDTADSPIIFNSSAVSNVSAGTYATVHDCFLNPTNALTTMSIRNDGTDDAARPTCRTFTKISGGSSLVDFSGMNYATLENSLGTMVKFSASSGKIHMKDNRITCQDDITISGVDHVIHANSWGFGIGKALYLAAAAANVTFPRSNAISINGIFGKSIINLATLGAGNPNYLGTGTVAFTFGWAAVTTNPVLGNATTFAQYSLDSDMCHTSLGMVVGSTTSVGSGVYTFALPFKASAGAVGAALVRASDGTYYPATFIVQAGGAVGIVYLVAGATAAWGSTTLALGTGASFNMTIIYPVATS